jgi:pyrroloquinoline-quinone synthase
MDHFSNPFGPQDIQSSNAQDNAAYFQQLLADSSKHPFFDHPFLSTFASGTRKEVVSQVLESFYKVVTPFTGLLCGLAGKAPDLRSRFALMDNIYEEMGQGRIEAAHPSMYVAMLQSIGISQARAEAAPTMPSIARINNHLRWVIEEEPFAVGCAVLAAAEATIPPSFPILAAATRAAFPKVDMTFFDRHGPRDEGHCNDAAMLFAVNGRPADHELARLHVQLDLDYRYELFDEWMSMMRASLRSTEAASSSRRLFLLPRAPLTSIGLGSC